MRSNFGKRKSALYLSLTAKHTAEKVAAMKSHLERLEREGLDSLNDAPG